MDTFCFKVYYDETRYGERWRSHDPTDREIMCSHLIDRSIRPLFAGFPANVMVNVCVLKTNWKHEADAELMAIIATSAALMKLNITQAGPIGVIRIGRINENIIINPTIDEQRRSDFNLLYVCTRQNTIMADLVASEISESDLATNIKLAQLEAVKCIDSQVKLRERYESDKKVKLLTSNSKNLQDTRTQSSNHSGREVALGQAHCVEIKSDVNRSDGRGSHQIRPVHCEAGYLHALHGSSLISCGETQVLCTATIGKPGETQSVDVLPRKSFRVDYDFPPFCTNHIMDIFSRRWREIGDGIFIEKALLAVIPSQRDFPYAIHLNSKVLASDGSSSTTSVCGGSIALMDAGVPIKSHVAGVSIGLVTDDETSNGQLENYRIITDTSGLENDLGEMDFKIAGTRNGITAIQLDAKSTLLSLDVIGEAIKYGRQAHLQILDHMEQAINSPKETFYYKERRIEDDTGNHLKLSKNQMIDYLKKQPRKKKTVTYPENIRKYINYHFSSRTIQGDILCDKHGHIPTPYVQQLLLRGGSNEEGAAAPVKDKSKIMCIENTKQCNAFKTRAIQVKEGLEGAVPVVTVTLNPEKPRRGCFEIREEGGETFISLLEMKRPFAPMKALDMEEVIEDIINKIK
ncbi:BnaA08g12540D [Brassica napus]|uniref:BnaA08g12540D protein n=1 Tax=Brassica napus TaxID=3708 RepID=A0A078GDZ2_BRANA|nr:BnaA08g12540D [Brassica napus]